MKTDWKSSLTEEILKDEMKLKVSKREEIGMNDLETCGDESIILTS